MFPAYFRVSLTSVFYQKKEDCVTVEPFTVVTMKNGVFGLYKSSSYLTRGILRLCYRAKLVNDM
jgi:hypothetical protein